MLADSQGRAAHVCISPNCDQRPGGETDVSLVVVHAISLPPNRFGGDAVQRLFTNALNPNGHPFFREIYQLRVSSHYFIRRDGELIQFVPPEMRAWHAGVSSWRGRDRCNDFSIGVELEGCDTLPFEPVQYEVLAQLIVEFCGRFPIQGVTGHSNIAPGRKTDPGPLFSWRRLRGLLYSIAGGELADMVESGDEDGVRWMNWPFPIRDRPIG